MAQALLGSGGKDLLARDGQPIVIQVAVPGALALDAANHFDIDNIRARGDVPHLISEFLKAWSYWLAHPGFQSSILKVDCGMIFRSPVPAAWIVEFDRLAN